MTINLLISSCIRCYSQGNDSKSTENEILFMIISYFENMYEWHNEHNVQLLFEKESM